MSVFILKEKVPLARWGAVALGFVGVFVACDPADLGVSLPVLLVLAAAFLWGLSIVLLRKIAMQEKTIVQMILNNSFFLVTAGLPLIYLWQTPSLGQVAPAVRRRLAGGLCAVRPVRRDEACAGLGDRAVRIHRAGLVVPARLPDLGRRPAQRAFPSAPR